VVYHNKLGTQGERGGRVQQIAAKLAQLVRPNDATFVAEVSQAAQLSKADLVTDMVGEFPELQGIMGRYYALNDGLSQTVADAIEDHYRPRFAGDTLPRNTVGVVTALADKLETLAGLFSIGQIPTGDKDPFALRRHALGVIRMLIEGDENAGFSKAVQLNAILDAACGAFSGFSAENRAALESFIYDRAASYGKDRGSATLEVDAVLAQKPQRFDQLPALLDAAKAFAGLAEAPALAAANKRIQNILKKSTDTIAPMFERSQLVAAEEIALADRVKSIQGNVEAHYAAGQFTNALRALAVLKEPVDLFFDKVMVNVEDPQLRANRLGLLASLNRLMNGAIDISKLAV
jgi:glycyl-tRNA synthetase beta chain